MTGRLACVDIGTNSVLLLIAEPDADGGLRAVHEACSIARTGQGLEAGGRLLPGAVARTLEVLADYAGRMERAGVSWRAALGTAALREAENARDLLAPAERLLGCPVQVVSGEREAALVLAGVRGALGRLPGRALILDVGGGSTELVLAEDGEVAQLVSLPLGAVRLTERHLVHGDPPPPEDLAALQQDARRTLAALPAGFCNAELLVGTSGTTTTMASVQLGLAAFDSDRINGQRLSLQEVLRQLRLYAGLPLDRRQQIPGLDPRRADIILAGACIVAAVMDHFEADALQVCDRGLRWGLLHEQRAALEKGVFPAGSG